MDPKVICCHRKLGHARFPLFCTSSTSLQAKSWDWWMRFPISFLQMPKLAALQAANKSRKCCSHNEPHILQACTPYRRLPLLSNRRKCLSVIISLRFAAKMSTHHRSSFIRRTSFLQSHKTASLFHKGNLPTSPLNNARKKGLLWNKVRG